MITTKNIESDSDGIIPKESQVLPCEEISGKFGMCLGSFTNNFKDLIWTITYIFSA